MTKFNRRTLLKAAPLGMAARLPAVSGMSSPVSPASESLDLFFSLKIGMVRDGANLTEKFAQVQRLGFDGIELDSPNGYGPDEVAKAKKATGLPVHGVVDSAHWQVRLSDPDPKVRAQGVKNLAGAVVHAHAYGGSAVLLVPGTVRGREETQRHVWERSIQGLRQVLPSCARLGIRILIENVWNGFCYQHNGPEDQGAELLRDYLDAINSPWVGSYFDIGNHQKYGRPAEWIRTLGPRIVKLDVKDWGTQSGFCKIGEGDVDWDAVRAALLAIGYTGWATAEVSGGSEERLKDVYRRMAEALRA